jgi:AcrR family transcriptional regulator
MPKAIKVNAKSAQQLPRSNRRERKRTEIRDRLYSAALELFAERGFQETTVEDITEAADVGKGTFFNYFPTKEHILAAFGSERIATIERALDEAHATKGAVLPIIRGLAIDLVGQSSRNPALLRAIYAAHASCPPVCAELRKRLHRGRQLMTELFAVAQERDEIRRDIPAAEFARLTQLMFLGVTLAWAMNPDSSLRKTAESVWDFLCPNLLPHEPEKHRRKLMVACS